MRTMILAVALCLALTANAQEGYFAKLLNLHDLSNNGPKPTQQTLKYGQFAAMGEICGVKFGISMTEAVAAWGKPKSIGYTGNGNYWYLRYGRGCSLGFSDNRLVSINMTAENLAGTAFDNGIRPDMTRAEVIGILGRPFHQSHSGISYKVGGRRVVSFTFQINGQFPENDAEWQLAKLWNISINGTEWVNNGMQADPHTSGH
ncbi:MAG: YjgB family protein [Candidatus Pacebacteria bacterium]|nr:YjgB family protein [Candidatus Paceibacterota bacterium]